MEAELFASKNTMTVIHGETSSSTAQEPTMVNTKTVAPPGVGFRRRFTEILANGTNAKRFTITVTPKDKQTSETIKEILKTKIRLQTRFKRVKES